MGRPTLCKSAIVDPLITSVRSGAHPNHAAAAAGVSAAALADWHRRAENALVQAGYDPDTDHIDLDGEWRNEIHPDDIRFVDFSLRMRIAEAQASATAAEKIWAADDWRAQAWWLERRARDLYPRPGIEVSGPQGGPIVLASIRDEIIARAGRYTPPEIINVDIGGEPKAEQEHKAITNGKDA